MKKQSVIARFMVNDSLTRLQGAQRTRSSGLNRSCRGCGHRFKFGQGLNLHT